MTNFLDSLFAETFLDLNIYWFIGTSIFLLIFALGHLLQLFPTKGKINNLMVVISSIFLALYILPSAIEKYSITELDGKYALKPVISGDVFIFKKMDNDEIKRIGTLKCGSLTLRECFLEAKDEMSKIPDTTKDALINIAEIVSQK